MSNSFFIGSFNNYLLSRIQALKSSSVDSLYTPQYDSSKSETSHKTAFSSIFEGFDLIAILKARLTKSIAKVSQPETKVDPKEEFTVAQNYGIMCPPKSPEEDEDVTITPLDTEVHANYGIVCGDYGDEDKPEAKKGPLEMIVSQNYGIVLCPVETIKTGVTKLATMFANYGIVCPSDSV